MGERDERAVEVGGAAYCDILRSITSGLRAKSVLEIGTGWGYSARAFAEGMTAPATIVSIDDARRIKQDNLDAIAATGVEFINLHGKSQNEYRPGPFDILYIDGDPTRVALDFARFSETVRDGGLIIIDGYGGQPGPTDTVDSLSVRHPFVTLPYNDVYSFSIHRKPTPFNAKGRHIAKCNECNVSSYSNTWSEIDEWADSHIMQTKHAVNVLVEPRYLKYRKEPR